MNKNAVKKYLDSQLPIDEGLRLSVYKCTAGKNTIGIGRNLDDKGLSIEECNKLGIPFSSRQDIVSILKKRNITKEEAFYLLDNDIEEVLEQIEESFIWMKDQPDVVWCVLANMCFNIGINRLKQFKKTLQFIQDREYEKASVEMLNSKWHSDVGKRAERLSDLLKTA